jgi:RND superfamily putative drug exporter
MLDRLLSRIADLALARAKRVLIVAGILVIAAGVFGFTVFGKLASGGFNDPGSQSSRAGALLASRFHATDPDVILVVTATGRRGVDDAAVAAAGTDLTTQIAATAGLSDVGSYWSLGHAASLRSDDGTRALIVASTGSTFGSAGAPQLDIAKKIVAQYSGLRAGGVIDVAVGGSLAINNEISSTITKDLARAEAISIPITTILLILVFGSLVSASLPLLIGLVSILGSFMALAVIASFTDVSVFSINLITGLGMGLGIDYALLIVNRFREELNSGRDVPGAVRATVRTTGRTIVFSGLTVALALSSMLVFPLYFLRSFAYAGVAVVLLAVLSAVVVLPALLAILGRRVDSLTVLRRSVHPPEDGFFSRLARRIMHRPVAIAVAIGVTALLVFLGTPFLGAKWGQVDERALPTSASSRQAQQLIKTQFSSQESSLSNVVLPDLTPSTTAAQTELTAYAEALSRVPGVARVDAATGTFVAGALAAPPTAESARYAPTGTTGTWLSVAPKAGGSSDQGQALVRALRGVPAPSTVLTSGNAAITYDTKAVLGAKLPWALAIIAIFTAILLFLFTGSIVVPLKALVLNLLSLSAMFGAMVWIFQEGHLSGLLHFTPTGSLDMSVPILMFCIAFGLSMDYEVFLLSRIKEEYDRTGDTDAAVVLGLQRTGRIITAAAGLLSIVFLAFATSHVANIKLMGLGVAVAVLIDATLVRALLVPAFMRLAGKWNWWAPAPLTRLYNRIGLTEAPVRDSPGSDDAAARPRRAPAEIG